MTSRFSGYKTSLKKFLCYLLLLWVIPKMTSANLCKLVHFIMNYSTSICPFESGKCAKEGKKLQKCEYLENEKTFEMK